MPAVYFAIGDTHKSSFATQFSRENNFLHFNDPALEDVTKAGSNCIVEGSLELFYELEKVYPELSLIFLGADYSNPK